MLLPERLMRPNENGLIYEEWLNAAGWALPFYSDENPGVDYKDLIKAWRKGEDPTEYRELASKQRVSNVQKEEPPMV